jgi:hypothetical protein
VVGAELELAAIGMREYAGTGGRFRFPAVPPGAYELRVRRLGYQSTTRRVVLDAGQRLDLDVALERFPHVLTEVVVEGRRLKVPARYEAVYARAARGWGRFFTRLDIERLNPLDLTSLFATVPGVDFIGGRICFKRCQATLTEGGPVRRCSPSKHVQVYVDGVRMTRGSGEADAVLRMVHPLSVEAMELYTGVAQIPAEFLEDACAIIAIWTRSY